MIAAQAPRYVPYDEFLLADPPEGLRQEWIDGAVYDMTRSTPTHAQLTVMAAIRILGPLSINGCRAYGSEAAIFIEAAKKHTYADGIVVCGPLITRVVHDKNGKSIGEAVVNPSVIVEVLSDSTEKYDRGDKFESYKELASFESYVLIAQKGRHIDVWTRDGDVWTKQSGGPGEHVRVRGHEVAVDSIYD